MSIETKEKKEPVAKFEGTQREALTIQSRAAQTPLFARQPLSTLSKIAFWALLISALSAFGGTIALTITSGHPSRDIVISMVCSLACAALVFTGMRWIQLLGTLLSGYLFYLIFTEPFVTESLAAPKGPSGGFGHFIGDVIVCACVLVAFGANIAASVQSFYQSGQQSGKPLKGPRWLPSAWSLVIGMMLGAILIGAISQPAVSTGTSYTNGVLTVHASAGNFLQPSVTITKGSKLQIVDDTSSLHILANGYWQNGTPVPEKEPGAPVVKNVQLHGNSVELGPFPVAGTYHLYCLVHPGMSLTITVQ